MIIKNISPYPKEIRGLGLRLMPGQQVDIGKFTQKERDDCFDLQEAFRRGEFVCVGVGHKDQDDLSHEVRAQRAFAHGHYADQPLIKVNRTFKQDVGRHWMQDGGVADGPLTEEYEESFAFKYKHPERTKVEEIEAIGGTTEVSEDGTVIIREFDQSLLPPPPLQLREREESKQPKPVEFPSISRERAREIIKASRCVGFRSNGQQCKRRPVTGYEYCITHMPEEVREEYNRKKKQAFFKD